MSVKIAVCLLAVALFSVNAFAGESEVSFLKDGNQLIELKIPTESSSVRFQIENQEVLVGHLELSDSESGSFLVPLNSIVCPAMKIEIHSSLTHRIRGTLASVSLVGDSTEISSNQECGKFEVLTGTYTRQGFQK